MHEKQKLHKCTICDNSFSQQAHLKIHIASVYEKHKPHKFTICDTSFGGNGDLKGHIASVHVKQKPTNAKQQIS